MEENNLITCLNCGTEFHGKYCPECGQRADTERFTIKWIFQNLIMSFLSIDGGVWITIKSLFTRPGQMMVDILNGKRKKYFSPFPMLFLVLSFYVLIFTFTGSERSKIDQYSLNNDTEIVAAEAELDDEDVLDEEFNEGFIWFFELYSSHYTTIYILSIPIFVFCARICFGKRNRRRYYWGEYSIPIIYSLIIIIFYRCLTSIAFYFSPDIADKMTSFNPILSILAISACFKKMLEFSVVKTIWRSILLYGIYSVILVFLIIGIVAIYTF